MRVLLVEDQAEMAEMVAVGLRRAQMAVDVHQRGRRHSKPVAGKARRSTAD